MRSAEGRVAQTLYFEVEDVDAAIKAAQVYSAFKLFTQPGEEDHPEDLPAALEVAFIAHQVGNKIDGIEIVDEQFTIVVPGVKVERSLANPDRITT